MRGRTIAETWWGARNGLLWFDVPGPSVSVCCPVYRIQTFLRWGAHGWCVVRTRHVRGRDALIGHPMP